MTVPDFARWYRRLKQLGTIAVFGVLALILCAVRGSEGVFGTVLMVLGAVTVLPAFIYAYCLTILHWKHRYIGNHSTLWGVLLIVETSGWMKIVYFFRHLLPDINGSGRYTTKRNVEPAQ